VLWHGTLDAEHRTDSGGGVATQNIMGSGLIASLYVNSYNTVARAAYARVGFCEVGTFATVLLD
jgi:predicted GNAT family acetyltransferase